MDESIAIRTKSPETRASPSDVSQCDSQCESQWVSQCDSHGSVCTPVTHRQLLQCSAMLCRHRRRLAWPVSQPPWVTRLRVVLPWTLMNCASTRCRLPSPANLSARRMLQTLQQNLFLLQTRCCKSCKPIHSCCKPQCCKIKCCKSNAANLANPDTCSPLWWFPRPAPGLPNAALSPQNVLPCQSSVAVSRGQRGSSTIRITPSGSLQQCSQ